jgi:tripartite-type tricarboxylate transporter receptor subunit TctC
VLAISADRRLPQAPDVPTLTELGYPLTAGTIRGFTFTAGVPKEAVATMEATLEKVHRSQPWKEFVTRNIFQDVFLGSAGFAKFLAQRLEEYRGFYDDVGLGKAKP